jgi:hypothetical protein
MQIFACETPFFGIRPHIIRSQVIKGELRLPRPSGRDYVGLNDIIWQAVEKCWQNDPSDRPSLEILETVLQQATKPGEIVNDANMKSDLVYCIPGMYRILELHSEQSSARLGKRIYHQTR